MEPGPQEPHPGIKLDICPSGEVTTAQNRRSSIVPEHLIRSLKERSRDSYQKIRELPQRTSAALSGPFQYAATPAAPLIQTVNSTSKGRPMDESVCEGPVVACGPGGRNASLVSLLSPPSTLGCLHAGGRCVKKVKSRAKIVLGNMQVSIVFRPQEPQERPTEQTLRIKNNSTGNCIYEVITTPSGEELHPIESLKHLFPNSKYLRSSLIAWNRHFQNPPQHWLINFIPRAYLRRGQFLAEEICNYLYQNPDGCKYRIEYEPIGHESCLVGTVIPRELKPRSRYWEGREKMIEG